LGAAGTSRLVAERASFHNPSLCESKPPARPRLYKFEFHLTQVDAETVRFLERIDLTPSKQAAVPIAQAFERRRRDLSAGTVLTREWGGQHHRVMVLDSGFAWQGRTYSSLSEIAKAITGTKWNGPRFFGLRDRKQPEASP
jgi:hypothetical protein